MIQDHPCPGLGTARGADCFRQFVPILLWLITSGVVEPRQSASHTRTVVFSYTDDTYAKWITQVKPCKPGAGGFKRKAAYISRKTWQKIHRYNQSLTAKCCTKGLYCIYIHSKQCWAIEFAISFHFFHCHVVFVHDLCDSVGGKVGDWDCSSPNPAGVQFYPKVWVLLFHPNLVGCQQEKLGVKFKTSWVFSDFLC